MEALPVMTLEPNVRKMVWGAETWVASGRPERPSRVADGPFAGRTLDALAAEYGRRLTGTKAPDARVFPLLFKIIDARDRLSVQVHPNEATRAATGGEPKTEMWYVLGGAGPIFAGLRPGTTPARVADDVKTGRFEDTLVRHTARPGDILFIPGGLVHAIGEDVRVYEVQQSSDTTWRLYDWGRVGADGQPRMLHIAEALQSIDYNRPPPRPVRDGVTCPFFRFRAVEADGAVAVAADDGTFTVVHTVADGRTVLVPPGRAASVPCTGTALVTTL